MTWLRNKLLVVLEEKDSMISELKKRLTHTAYPVPLQVPKVDLVKKVFKPSPGRKNTGSDSERSLRSLAYLMEKQNRDQMRRTKVKVDREVLSDSYTETLSGSSTTSIVNKWYNKSWKQEQYVYEEEGEDDEQDDQEYI